eukprot:7285344-Prymnesium_polylepis.1
MPQRAKGQYSPRCAAAPCVQIYPSRIIGEDGVPRSVSFVGESVCQGEIEEAAGQVPSPRAQRGPA